MSGHCLHGQPVTGGVPKDVFYQTFRKSGGVSVNKLTIKIANDTQLIVLRDEDIQGGVISINNQFITGDERIFYKTTNGREVIMNSNHIETMVLEEGNS